MASPWVLYDDLIDLVPPDLAVRACVVSHWAAVTDDFGGAGISTCYRGGSADTSTDRRFVGRPLRDLAALVRSWDFELASLGAAALNCGLTTAGRLEGLPQAVVPAGRPSAFDLVADEVRGRKIAVVGHFGKLDPHREDPELDITVLERSPIDGDLPDPAAEYVLPESDLVFITGSAIVNKTLPRLLQLSAGAEVRLVGPSTPLAPEVFTGWVSELSGSLVVGTDGLIEVISAGASLRLIKERLRQYTVPLA